MQPESIADNLLQVKPSLEKAGISGVRRYLQEQLNDSQDAAPSDSLGTSLGCLQHAGAAANKES